MLSDSDQTIRLFKGEQPRACKCLCDLDTKQITKSLINMKELYVKRKRSVFVHQGSQFYPQELDRNNHFIVDFSN